MDFTRLFDLLPYQAQRYPQQVALAEKINGQWKKYSTEECLKKIDQLSIGFLQLGLKAGDSVGIMSAVGSPPWNFVDLALQQIGVIVVPIHAAIQPAQLTYILKDANIQYCFVADEGLYHQVHGVKANAPELKKIYTFVKLPKIPHWEELLIKLDPDQKKVLQHKREQIKEEDLATIIYTSGTTGQPKGVMLSHRNIVSNIKSTITLLPIDAQKRTISFLPMSHIFERMAVYAYFVAGVSLYYARSTDHILEDIQDVRPHYFTAVPRLLERMYDSILEQADGKSRIKRSIIRWSLQIGKRFKSWRRMNIGYQLKLALADLLVYRHWRKVLGGKVQGVIVGAAALQPELGLLFSAAKIEIREGYGLTETSPAIAFNRFEPGGVHFGTVGIPVPGVELKIDDPNEYGEGEIVVRGPNVMMGYYQKPKLTKEVIDEEGWFRTGDVGKIVYKRFLQITDRKKDIFKTSSGKYVAPQKIESLIKSSRYFSQCMSIGFNRPYVTALIIPNFVHLERWCQENKVHWTAPQYMVHNPKVIDFFESIIQKINSQLDKEAKVRRICLLHEEWSVTTGEYAQTLKLKRDVILDKFSKQITEMYHQKGDLIA